MTETVIDGVHSTTHEWDWLWSSILFMLDPTCWPPRDMGGYCHYPFGALVVTNEARLGQRFDEHGPALWFYNLADQYTYGSCWWWYDLITNFTGPMAPDRRRWTVALAWANWRPIFAEWNTLLDIHQAEGYRRKLAFHQDSNMYEWLSPGVQQQFPAYMNQTNVGEPATVVITEDYDLQQIRGYSNGRPSLTLNGKGSIFNKVWEMYLGCIKDGKESAGLQGTVGSFIIARGAWGEAEVAQFNADPRGFLRPDYTWRQPFPIQPEPPTRPPCDWFDDRPMAAWLTTLAGVGWLTTLDGSAWLLTRTGTNWLASQAGTAWLLTRTGTSWLASQASTAWLASQAGSAWSRSRIAGGWFDDEAGEDWRDDEAGEDWCDRRRCS